MHRHVSKTVSNISRVKLSKYIGSYKNRCSGNSVPVIVSSATAALSHRQTASFGTSRYSSRDQGHHKRDTSTVRVILVNVLLLSKQK